MSANGQLTASELSPIAGGGYLRHDAAAAWNAMAAEIYRRTGQRIRVNGPDSAYRNLDRQRYWKNYWCSRGACQNAATPGTSNHGWGIAVDVPDYVRVLIVQYGRSFGWDRGCSDAPWESWHHKWCGGWSGKNPGPDYKGGSPNRYPTIRKGTKKRAAVKRAQRHLNRWNDGMTKPAVDGTFGDKTKKAVKQFQAVHGLKPDGVVGKNTWRKLRRRDYLYQDERRWWNRIKLLRRKRRQLKNGLASNERRHLQDLLHKVEIRYRSIRKVALEHGWKGENRGKRYKILRSLVPNK